MINPALMSSASVEWYTPKDFFESLEKKFGKFDLDPCATPESALCENYFTKETNGLIHDWFGRVYMNPPFGREIKLWVEKAYKESLRGVEVVCLLPARTDTKWFHDYCLKGDVEFLKGRLKFSGHKNSAPFPCVVVHFKPGMPEA